MLVFSDQEPFDELNEEEIKIEEMKQPWDMSTSKDSQSIFISDPGNRCLWRIPMPGGDISRWAIHGLPSRISITPSDEVIVVVDRGHRYCLYLYSCSNVKQTRSIPLSTEIKEVFHAVQSINEKIIISYSTEDFPIHVSDQ